MPCKAAAPRPVPRTAAAGSPSSGHLCQNRALICDPWCSTFPFPPVSPPPVVCAWRSGTRRRPRSSWSGRSPALPARHDGDSRAPLRRLASFVPEPGAGECASLDPRARLQRARSPSSLFRGGAATSDGRPQLHRRRANAVAMAPTDDERERPPPLVAPSLSFAPTCLLPSLHRRCIPSPTSATEICRWPSSSQAWGSSCSRRRRARGRSPPLFFMLQPLYIGAPIMF
jgi:hypothetical protein